MMSIRLPWLCEYVFIFQLTARLSRKEQTAYAEAGAVAEQALSSIKTVATFGGEEKEEKR